MSVWKSEVEGKCSVECSLAVQLKFYLLRDESSSEEGEVQVKSCVQHLMCSVM